MPEISMPKDLNRTTDYYTVDNLKTQLENQKRSNKEIQQILQAVTEENLLFVKELLELTNAKGEPVFTDSIELANMAKIVTQHNLPVIKYLAKQTDKHGRHIFSSLEIEMVAKVVTKENQALVIELLNIKDKNEEMLLTLFDIADISPIITQEKLSFIKEIAALRNKHGEQMYFRHKIVDIVKMLIEENKPILEKLVKTDKMEIIFNNEEYQKIIHSIDKLSPKNQKLFIELIQSPKIREYNITLEDMIHYTPENASLFEKIWTYSDPFGQRLITDEMVPVLIKNPKRASQLIDLFSKINPKDRKELIYNFQQKQNKIMNALDSFMKLSDEQYKTALQLVNKGINKELAPSIVLNEQSYNRVMQMQSIGIHPDTISRIALLPIDDIGGLSNLISKLEQITPNKGDNIEGISKVLEQNPNINLKAFVSYIDQIDFNSLYKLAPNMKDYTQDQMIRFLCYHYKAGNKNFDADTLTLTSDFTNYLKENYVNYYKMNEILTVFPLTKKEVGTVPDGWLSNVESSKRAEVTKAIYDTMTEAQKMIDGRMSVYKKVTSFLEERLSKLLNTNVSVKFLDNGAYGSAFKFSINCTDDLCLKLFTIKTNQLPNYHGKGIETQTALFVNEHSSGYTNFYFGRVADKYSSNGFYVTKFISKDIQRTPTKTKPTDYEITNGDAYNNNNQIWGTIVDFGGTIIYDKNGVNLTELDE